jgi:hypothetical protein
MWRFRGSPHYLDQQARRLGITQVLADRARHNPDIFRLAALLAQLCERYHRARKENGKPVFYSTELGQIKGTLEQCELELQKLHMLAGAADAMLEEAWEAFGYEAPQRRFNVHCEHDGRLRRTIESGSEPAALAAESAEPPFPLGDGTVGVPADDSDFFAQSLSRQ